MEFIALAMASMVTVSFSAAPTGPVWSWDTFPAFFHSSDQSEPGGGFSDAALDTIERFPMVRHV